MKARLAVDDLRVGLATVKPALRPAQPFVVLDTKEGEGLMLATDNWDVQIRTQLTGVFAPAKGRGRVAVPHRPLAELTAHLSGVEVEMAVKDEWLEVRSGDTDMRLPIAEFDLPNRVEPEGDERQFSVVDWEAIWRVAAHAGVDPTRPTLQSVLFEEDAVAATDSYRLGVYRIKTGLTSQVPASMIPRVTDEELEEVTMTADDRAVKITVGATTSWGSPIAAEGPKWRPLLDRKPTDKIVFDSEAMIDTISRVSIAGRDAPLGGTVMLLEPIDEVSMNASSDSEPNDPNGHVEELIATQGELPFRFAVSTRFLTEAVKVIGMDKTEVGLTNANQPIFFEHAGFTVLLMLMKPLT